LRHLQLLTPRRLHSRGGRCATAIHGYNSGVPL
jgi:hypothetical protein